MKQSILTLIVFLFSFSAVSQNNYTIESTVKNQRQINALGEIGGNGLILSVGLEHAKYEHNVLKNTIRWGFSFLDYLVFGEYNMNFGRNKNYFELGAGPSLYYDQGLNLFVYGRIGYRFNSDRFIVRVGFTPYFIANMGSNIAVMPHFGITLGVPIKRF